MVRICRFQAVSKFHSNEPVGHRWRLLRGAFAANRWRAFTRRGSRAVVQQAIVFFAGVFLAGTGLRVAIADDGLRPDRDPVHLGTFKVRSRSKGESLVKQTEHVRQLYRRALAEIEKGDRATGQRTLENLVARFPDTPQAQMARRRLAGLYAELDETRPQNAGSSGAANVRSAVHSERGDGLSVAAKTLAPIVGVARGGELRQLRRLVSQSLSDDLRLEVGDRVFFSPNSAELGTKARRVLSAQAQWLRVHASAGVLIEGHADEPGGDARNHQLSARRAAAVRERLIAEGVSKDRLHIAAVGRSGPGCTLFFEFVCGSES